MAPLQVEKESGFISEDWILICFTKAIAQRHHLANHIMGIGRASHSVRSNSLTI